MNLIACSGAWQQSPEGYLLCSGTLQEVPQTGLSAEDRSELVGLTIGLFAIVFGVLALKKALS